MPIGWLNAGTAGGLTQPVFTSTTTRSMWATPTASALYNAMTQAQQATWAQQTYASATAPVWISNSVWEDDVTPTQYYNLARERVVISRERTAEELRLAEERRAAAMAVERERRAIYEQARMRSHDLLVANLTKEQRETFAARKWFIVEGGKSKQRYRIRDAGHAGNIDVMGNGERVMHRLCCHCDHSIPTYDNMLAQKITLECDEDRFLRLANRHAA